LDGPASFWVGSPRPDFSACSPDDGRLRELQRALELLLRDQHLREAAVPDDSTYPRVAALVVRAWARWLPAVHGATIAFLVRNCLARAGRVRISETEIDVLLDPAPLDVVLEMAGCFRPLESVGWLGARRMSFAVNREPSGS
jgi:hypothetical protein